MAILYQDLDVINESFRVEAGRIRAFEGPGLGVTLDWDIIDTLHV